MRITFIVDGYCVVEKRSQDLEDRGKVNPARNLGSAVMI